METTDKITDKSLKEKAIKIKGKDYVLVSDRVIYFNETYPNGCIKTERLTEGDKEIIKATVYPDCLDMDRNFTGWSQATRGDGYINKTSALENAETSAVGRALAMMGIGVIDSIASLDEIHKAENEAKTSKIRTEDWLKKAMADEEFMRQSLDEDAWINQIKSKYTFDEATEEKLRKRYKEVVKSERDAGIFKD